MSDEMYIAILHLLLVSRFEPLISRIVVDCFTPVLPATATGLEVVVVLAIKYIELIQKYICTFLLSKTIYKLIPIARKTEQRGEGKRKK